MTQKANKCNNNTVFTGAEVGGASLVPLYCRLGIKSGSGVYSGNKKKKKKKDEQCIKIKNCGKTILNIYMCSITGGSTFPL